ncbi:MAG: AAA family ATPase [Acidobacteria bacterium]|nr:AAA family ATPase [Acidobacteriota bacterium]
MENIRDLDLLVVSRTPIIGIESAEEERVRAHVEGLAARQDLPWFEWKATAGLRRAGTTDPIYDTEKPAPALKAVLEMRTEALYLFLDLQRHFDDPAILRSLRDIGQRFAEDRRCLILCAPDLPIPPDLRTCASLIRLELPDARELKELAVRTLKSLGAPQRVRIDLTLPELEQLVQSLRGLTLAEAQRVLMRAALDDLKINREDFKHILERKKALIARDGVLDLYPQEATLQQVGGLDNLKDWLRRRGAAFSAEAQRHGLEPPRGVLLLGVQGCGKSLCAKAVAAEWGLALLRLDAGALYDKYVGESEKNLRRAMQTAEAMAPCVLWIDEIEKGMSGREGSASDGGLARRMFGSFVSWLQERKSPVFVVATANDIEALPPELLRKGRFDEIFFVDLPDDAARRSILAVHLARRRQDPARFSLGDLAAGALGFSGAEIEAAIVSALYASFAEKKPLSTAHVLAALRATVPLSRTCRESIEALRAWAKGRAVPASGDPRRPATSAA